MVALIEPQTMNEDGTLDVTIQASDVDDEPSLTLPWRRSRLSLAVTNNIVSTQLRLDGVGDVVWWQPMQKAPNMPYLCLNRSTG